ncbi:hypothetical protein DTL70_27160 [Streptomyces diacarni]|uniref:Uncharacterized protein n=1 Tax=Streptomyces diacarni TaxID=2800381 RepID=A0A367EI51_9ACTN|nr:hypothetical protein DTL70_27160 [Streptomyces diacarni]
MPCACSSDSYTSAAEVRAAARASVWAPRAKAVTARAGMADGPGAATSTAAARSGDCARASSA